MERNAVARGEGGVGTSPAFADAPEAFAACRARVDAALAAFCDRHLPPPAESATAAAIRELAAEAHKLNETCRIYVNLMAANVRRRLQVLAGSDTPAYRPQGAAAYA